MIGKTNQLIYLSRSKNRGFTLIELLIAIAILGILAAIVIPSYQAQVQSTRRGDAVASLLDTASALEDCRSTTLAYDDATCTAPYGGNNVTVASQRGFFNINVNATSPTTFLLTATPVNADNECTSMTYNHAGLRTAVDNNGADTRAACWKN